MKRDLDILNGSIWDKMILFALPLAFSSTLQQLFNAADVAVVGRFAGQEALAAVGANAPVINLLVNLFVGLSVGSNAVISRYIGQENPRKVSKAIHTSVCIALISGLFLSVVGITLAKPILNLLGTPDNILDMAALYLSIYFSGMPFIMLYNFSAAILRSKGDTRRPLLALSAAGVINVILNLIFVIGFHMAVAGVALATILSNVISSLLLVLFLTREKGDFHLSFKKLNVDFKVLKDIAAIGVPAGLQGVVFSISNVLLQSAINRLGHVYIAANTAALNYEYIAYYLFNAFNSAALTFISQNYAAGNFKRARKCAGWAFVLASASGFVVNTLFILTRHQTICLFTADPAVQKIACTRILILLSFEFFNGCIEILSGILRGYGKSLTPTLIAILGICGLRILMIVCMPQTGHPYEYLMWAYPISWMVTSAALATAYWIETRHLKRSEKRYAQTGNQRVLA